MEGYKYLISYKLASIAFYLGWEFTPLYFKKYEDSRQRDQIKQALRSYKQNIVEGSSERSLSTKLKLYDVAKASSKEAQEDFEDILQFEGLSKWMKNDKRLILLRGIFESNSSYPSLPPYPSIKKLREVLEGLEGKGGLDRKKRIEGIVNYLIDVIIRGGYLLDKQINAVEQKHTQEGGYTENLFKKRILYRKQG